MEVLEEFTIANEFATVVVRKLKTANGVQLQLTSPKLGYSIRLGPLEAESLTWQDEDIFSEFLAEPFGPGQEADDGS